MAPQTICFRSLCRTKSRIPSLIHSNLRTRINGVNGTGSRLFQSTALRSQQYDQGTPVQDLPNPAFQDINRAAYGSSSTFVSSARPSLNGEALTVDFHDGAYTFHSQWLHDALVTDASTKEADEAYGQQSSMAHILEAGLTGSGFQTVLNVTWDNGRKSQFPAPWLRVYASTVAKSHTTSTSPDLHTKKGWQVNTLDMPEFSYSQIFQDDPTSAATQETIKQIYDTLLHEHGCGIMKVVDLPEPIAENERNGINTINTQILRRLFGSVFIHPRRGGDLTFNIASHHAKDVKKGDILPNYNTDKVCLTHTDQSFYMIQSRVNSLYNLEGESINTFVSCEGALETLRQESPELVEPLCTVPVAIGRVAKWYSPFLYQANQEPAVTLQPGSSDRVQRFRWHPHLTGSLLAPYEQFPLAIAAHRRFQEILRRDSHELRVHMKPGDLYIFDNFRVLHGRERVLGWPRTNVGQSVHAQNAADTYREFKLNRLMAHLEEKWLVHMPQAQLNHLEQIVDAWRA